MPILARPEVSTFIGTGKLTCGAVDLVMLMREVRVPLTYGGRKKNILWAANGTDDEMRSLCNYSFARAVKDGLDGRMTNRWRSSAVRNGEPSHSCIWGLL